MNPQTYLPHPALSPYVRRYVIVQFELPKSGVEIHTSPKGTPAILFPFNHCSSLVHRISGGIVHTDLTTGCMQPYLTWQSKDFAVFDWRGKVSYCIVILQANALYPLLHESASCFINSIYSLDAVGLYSYFRSLQDQLWSKTDFKEVISLIESYLLRYFLMDKKAGRPTLVPAITSCIEQHQGLLSVKTLADKFGLSRRRLEQLFAVEIGLTPKEFSRVIRFREVLKRVYADPQLSWMQVVADFNYTDQSHLIKDFRQFMGVTPTVITEERPVIEEVVYLNGF